jgi:hypothetical protein
MHNGRYPSHDSLTIRRAPPYDKLQLDRLQGMIRLFKFETRGAPPGYPGIILANFKEADRPPYIALSYMWGDTSAGNMKCVCVNGEDVRITENLWSFLPNLFTDDRYLETWFWADQICMNQQDGRERDHQVTLMGNIFSKADVVFAWLGRKSQYHHGIDVGTFEQMPCRKGRWAFDQWHDTHIWTALDLLRQEYWSRLWIVQELILARDVQIWYAHLQFSAKMVYQIAEKWSRHRVVAEVQRLGAEVSFRDLDQVRELLKPFFISGTRNKKPLYEVLKSTSETSCKDPRDKVYGVQALVLPSQRIRVAYTRSVQQVFNDAIRVMFEDQVGQRKFCVWALLAIRLRGGQDDPGSFVTKLKSIEFGMMSTSHLSTSWAWSYILPRMACEVISLKRCGEWSISNWNQSGWLEIWERVRRLATTEKQLLFNEKLQTLVCETPFRRLWHRSDCAVMQGEDMHVCISNGCAGTPLPTNLSDKAKSMVNNIAARRGFVMYGEFLSHPDDWCFPDETPSEVFAGRDWDYWNVKDVYPPSSVDWFGDQVGEDYRYTEEPERYR